MLQLNSPNYEEKYRDEERFIKRQGFSGILQLVESLQRGIDCCSLGRMSQIVRTPLRPEHLAILNQGVEAWNKWKKHTSEEPNLMGQQFVYNKWSGIDLSKTKLFGCVLHGIKCKGADLSGANLAKADITWADWRGVNFKGAYFCYTNFIDMDLRGADFTDVIIEDSVFANCDLREVKGLDKMTHRRPSTVGIDTIYRSRGEIPESFLRGCGVPENLTRYMRDRRRPAAAQSILHSTFIPPFG